MDRRAELNRPGNVRRLAGTGKTRSGSGRHGTQEFGQRAPTSYTINPRDLQDLPRRMTVHQVAKSAAGVYYFCGCPSGVPRLPIRLTSLSNANDQGVRRLRFLAIIRSAPVVGQTSAAPSQGRLIFVERNVAHTGGASLETSPVGVHAPEARFTYSMAQAGVATGPIVVVEGDEFACSECGKEFATKAQVKRHARTHSQVRPFSCDVCLKTFMTKCNLTKHTRIHTGERPYECTICRKAFGRRAILTKHMRVHTGERLYHCTVCSRDFATAFSLSNHERLHTGDRPYECPICRKTFAIKGNLTSHLTVHTKDAKYKCDVCEKLFRHRSSLNMHVVKFHSPRTGTAAAPSQSTQ
ncbi:unnamed protein product (mitochondrion) [Plasmodiophora brassicae]|uniref:C2H2-type domain-containing protein n=2 Tax=Plasmodiophora brassicae TaxID=37360 RepID=A0A3P3XYI0_PLABS|nr:unnamed protein product [Plasmodiophora brassicae]